MTLWRPAAQLHRVVVTGYGAVTPLGLTASESWQKALSGQSGIAPITRFPVINAEKPEFSFDVHFAGEVKNFPADKYIEKKEQKKMDLFIQYAVAAASMAIESSGLKISPENETRGGVYVGVGIGGLGGIEEQHTKLMSRGPSRISPFFIPSVITNLASGQISIQFGLKGPNFSITSACATGGHSIGEAARAIQLGACDYVLAGGSESTIVPLALSGFAAMKALSTRNDSPTTASRPFDKDRDGFVLGEGSAVLMLESLEHAKKRGANIICELLGYGASSDAFHMSAPEPTGAGATLAMKLALKDAGLNSEQVDYINAHGTSTPLGDVIETKAIKSAFGHHSKKLMVSSTKSMTGHTLGAAGAIESLFCVLALRDQVVPPTINLENPDSECDLDYVPKSAREKKIQYVLNNTFGFGGTNASLLFGKI